MFKRKNVLWVMIGLIGMFSIGYYVLPVFFRRYALLDYEKDGDIVEVLLMSIIFFFFILLGVVLSERFFNKRRHISYRLNVLDNLFFKHYKSFYIISLAIWFVYYFTNDLTSYSSNDVDSYFLGEKSSYSGVWSALYNLSLSIIAVCTALSFKYGNKKWWYALIYCILVMMLLITGQRLYVITPIFMLVGSFCIFINFKKCMIIIYTGILLLLIISPAMVFIRVSNKNITEGVKIENILLLREFQSRNSSSNNAFISIIERADLLYNMSVLKKRYDNHLVDFNIGQYLLSVPSAYLPRFLYAQKPHPLSDNGNLSGEISVQAWDIIVGKNSLGSLSAFGAITAYREGGWLWVVINGLLTGFLFVWIYHFLAKGGYWAKILFISIFVTLSIKNVPVSFFYFLVFIAPVIKHIIGLSIINFLLRSKKSIYSKTLLTS
jgi:hypothetical protein